VIGKIVLTMLVAAAKINQSSIVPAFDQTRVPRIIQVPSNAETDAERRDDLKSPVSKLFHEQYPL
jgi:hypothetical protein